MQLKNLLTTYGVLGVLLVLGIIYIVMFGSQTNLILSFNNLVKADDRAKISVVPQSLPSLKASKDAGMTVNHYGYQFTAPWKKTIRVDTRADNTMVLTFSQGPELYFTSPKHSTDLVKEIQSKLTPKEQEAFNKVFDRNTFATNYAFYDTVLAATPDRMSPFMPYPELSRLFYFNWMKSSLLARHDPRGRIYKFDFGAIKGFQFGDPAFAEQVDLVIFDVRDRPIEMSFFKKDIEMSQDQINRILETFHLASIKQLVGQ